MGGRNKAKVHRIFHLHQHKTSCKIDKNMCVGVSEAQNTSQNTSKVMNMGPKIDENGSLDPFAARVASKAAPGCEDSFVLPRLFDLSAETWSIQGPILAPKGVQKRVQNRHDEARSAPWGAKKGQNTPPKGDPEMGPKK